MTDLAACLNLDRIWVTIFHLSNMVMLSKQISNSFRFWYYRKLTPKRAVSICSVIAIMMYSLLYVVGHHFHVNPIRMTRKLTIPMEIHQMWRTELIPAEYHELIKSWMKNDPNLTYWIWTETEIWTLVENSFPEHITLFNSYTNYLQKLDMAKYMILYEYGGIYADMDVESLQPMGSLLKSRTCVFGEDHKGHARLTGEKKMLLGNAVMACSKKHPFLLQVIRNLVDNYLNSHGSRSHSTGSIMLTTEALAYMSSANQKHNNTILSIVHSKVFSPRIDRKLKPDMKRQCGQERNNSDTELTHICLEMLDDKDDALPIESYTDHKWIDSAPLRLKGNQGSVYIKDLVKNVNKLSRIVKFY